MWNFMDRADRQTDTHTNVLIAILCNPNPKIISGHRCLAAILYVRSGECFTEATMVG